jgi:uncharacterized RDD family membrane protein YckC
MSRKQIPFAIALLFVLYSFGWLAYNLILYAKGGFNPFSGSLRSTIVFTIYTLTDFLGLAALIVYATSGYRNSAMLRFYFSFFAFPLATGVLFNIILMVLPGEWMQRYVHDMFTRPSYIIFSLLIPMIELGLTIWAMHILRAQRTPRVVTLPGNEGPVYTFAFINKGLRFCNLLIDDILILFTILSKSYVLNYFGSGINHLNDMEEALASALLPFAILFFRILYYLFHEGIFNTTPGKLVTGSAIIDENGNRPNFVQVLGRSFSRIIPFEPLIYLFTERPLHDSLPGTWVVEETTKEG